MTSEIRIEFDAFLGEQCAVVSVGPFTIEARESGNANVYSQSDYGTNSTHAYLDEYSGVIELRGHMGDATVRCVSAMFHCFKALDPLVVAAWKYRIDGSSRTTTVPL